MDFLLSEEQQALREHIIRFARKELNHEVDAFDREQRFPHEGWLKCGGMGFQGLPIPEAYGGGGYDPLTTAIALEALGYGCRDGGLVFSICAHLLAVTIPIWRYGSEEQKRHYLPHMCNGSWIGVNAMSEPSSGSDAFSMKTTAERDVEGFRINGTKTFSSNGPIANVALVFATTASKTGTPSITAFLVEKESAGFRVGQKFEKMGLRTSPMSELVFDNVYVGPEAVLGGVGGGSAVFVHSMDWERICLFATHVGVMDRLLETSIAYARSRTQFGQAIGKFQSVSHTIADMKVRLEAARLLLYRAASRLESSRGVALDASLAKLFISESFVQSARDTVQILGGYGYMTEYEVERTLRDAIGSTIYSGTSEMQRNIIARWLGL